MLEFEQLLHTILTKDELEVRGKKYKIKNATFAADDTHVLKLNLVLENTVDTKIVDIDMSIALY